MTVGQYLRKHREMAGFSQIELANMLNCSSAQSVSNVERGLSYPGKHHLKYWCSLIGADFEKTKKMMVKAYAEKLEAATA